MSKFERKIVKIAEGIREMGNADDWYLDCSLLEMNNDDPLDDEDETCFSDINRNQSDAYEDKEERESHVTQSKVYHSVLNDDRVRYCDDCGGAFYLKEQNGCYYRKVSERELKNYVANLLPLAYRSKISRNCKTNVLDGLQNEPLIKFNRDADAIESLVNCKNGVLNVLTLELLPHDFAYGFDNCIDAQYLEGATLNDAPVFKKYLETSFANDEERIKLSLQTKGFLYSNVPAKKGVFEIGESNSGKSVDLKLLTKMIGKDHVSNVRFHELGKSFYLDKLSDKKVNSAYELKNIRSDCLDTFKSITGGGDSLMAEKKGKDPYFFIARVKLLFAGNVMPKTKEMELTDAFLNRVVILRFPVSIPDSEQDPLLVEKLFDERDVIFSLAMKELPALCQNGFSFVSPKADRKYIEGFRQSISNLQSFVRDQCILGKDQKIWTYHLYAAYQEYCNLNNFEAYSKTKFNEAFDAMPGLHRRKFRSGLSSPRYGYQGIGLRKEGECNGTEIID